MSLSGKCAVVTGSNSGIGLGVAEGLASRGVNVVLNSFTDIAEDHALADRLTARGGGAAHYVQGDMSDPDACRALIERAAAHFGQVDILSTTPASSTSPRSRNFPGKNGMQSSRSTCRRPFTQRRPLCR